MVVGGFLDLVVAYMPTTMPTNSGMEKVVMASV
jgi:hypothetical protein